MQNSAPNSKKCSKGAQRNRERPRGGPARLLRSRARFFQPGFWKPGLNFTFERIGPGNRAHLKRPVNLISFYHHTSLKTIAWYRKTGILSNTGRSLFFFTHHTLNLKFVVAWDDRGNRFVLIWGKIKDAMVLFCSILSNREKGLCWRKLLARQRSSWLRCTWCKFPMVPNARCGEIVPPCSPSKLCVSLILA